MSHPPRGKSRRTPGRPYPALVAFSLIAALAPPILAQESNEGAESARLELCDGSACAPAPLLETDIDITVTGIIARTRVTQRFHNPRSAWVEGVYVFPLPADAAVDHLLMYVGPRVIEGRIEERLEARRIYERARDSGIKASLVEQERPNLFRTSVANIGPNEMVEIEIELQHLVRYDAGVMRLRFPTVVAERYTSDPESESFDPIVELANAVPRATVPVNPVNLRVSIDPGFPLQSLYSPSHLIETEEFDGLHLVTLRDRGFADRDFVVIWQPEPDEAPISSVFYEEIAGQAFALLMLLPPSESDANAPRTSREVVYVIDSSGSMGGTSIRFAKTALLMALDQLQPGDYFDVIDFDSEARSLFGGSIAADADAIDEARAFVDGLAAEGGTNIAAALDLALVAEGSPTDVRQVVFITDGAVGNESELFAKIARDLGDTRLFTVGIGSAPNAHFLRKAAHFGRGTYTFIGSPQEISEGMGSLFEKLESAVLTDLEVDWHDSATPEAAPRTVPDLYVGEPLVVTARLPHAPERVELSGLRGGKLWSVVEALPELGTAGVDRGIGRLWARREIDGLMDDLALGGDREDIRDEVIDLAFDHNLVTKFTSLVAVDVSASAPAGAAQQHMLPLNRPAGALPSTATPAALHAVISVVLMAVGTLLSAPRRRSGRSRNGKEAP